MNETANPLLAAWDGPLGSPPFDAILPEDFISACKQAIASHDEELAAIVTCTAPANFDDVIAALERSGATLARIRRLFWTLASAQATPAIRAIEGEMSALLSSHGTAISHDAALFSRIAAVYADRGSAGLTAEQKRLVENTYASFVRGGAALAEGAKARFADIDARLAELSVMFGQNVLAATNAWTLSLGEEDLAGLPQSLRDAAAARALAAGEAGQYYFTLDRTDYEGFLAFSARRDLRERLWRAFTSRCDGGGYDNWPGIAETLALRHERAQLLGYPDYAAYQLDDSMAKTPDAALALLMQLWEPAKVRAAEEAAELQRFIEADEETFALAPWDWRFYAERVRRDRFALDGAAIQQHLRLDRVRSAAFEVAGRLYGLHFARREDIATYHPDAWVWEVLREDGSTVGLLLTDYLARPEKHGGAWMGSLRVQEKLDGPILPIAYLVANFASAPPPDTAATRLSLDEARTLFHEFGHALHGLLSDVTYPSLSGTAVARDFVEFPSKFMENWIISREVLGSLGVAPQLIDAIRRAETYGQGFATLELVSCALIDLALHSDSARGADPEQFVEAELERLSMPGVIGLRHRLPYFTHVFDGGYASAYYSYLWSEVLDADAFAAFVEAGDLFDPATASRFKAEVLAQGDKRDPMESFVAFRGRRPDGGPLMQARGLANV
ncbi:M3 family metallopeptidase [Novosphingobium sp. G106]|uniref:M3 family metallopeptidase n=1 Tax=Novosphingobium sp. G106 TaxID=2849500 RepID=UPI001C2D9998|nr:M3 family metallopeptidase [Novosphingobium sp. G106]MBV1687769.1 M3 family metallopeptidase [Novosphingobium sp. G106]